MEKLVKSSDNFFLHDQQDLWGSSSDDEDEESGREDQSEQEDANVSEENEENGDDEDLYEYNPAQAYGSPPIAHF
jgi:hypothetical protein